MPAVGPNETSFKPGKIRAAGRRKGTPNKLTTEVKQGFLAAFEKLEPQFERWVEEVAIEDPGQAAKILVSMADFIFPRISRAVVTGDGGGPVEFVIRDLGSEPGGK
jgi:hypothetical protein